MSQSPSGIDREVVEKARRGDTAGLEALVEAAYPLVRRWTLVQTGQGADADDLTQDVLIRMVQKLSTFHGDSRFETWLYALTRNAVADRGRSRSRRRRLLEGRDAMDLPSPGPAPDPTASVERSELRTLLEGCFRALPPRQREVVDLVDMQGITASEAAELMDIEPVSVRAHLFKARRTLRRRLLEHYPEYLEDLA